MEITAIFTCFNRKEKTISCIDSLLEGNRNIKFNFIVVDDCSTDGTNESIIEKYDNVTVINGTGNLYYSGGMREGIKYAKDHIELSDYILFLNDDVEFYENAVEQLIGFDNTNKYIIVGATEDGVGNLTYGGVIKTSKVRPKFKIVMSLNENKQFCDTFNANCVLIPFDIFKSLDNIDKVYGHSLGDFDFGLSAVKKGFKILVSDYFVGVCCNNPIKGTWYDLDLSRSVRLRKKENKKGLPAKEWFHFINKNYNIVSAIIFSITQYIKIIINK